MVMWGAMEFIEWRIEIHTKVEQDSPRLKDRKVVIIRVYNGRYAVIGRDGQELWFELISLADIHSDDLENVQMLLFTVLCYCGIYLVRNAQLLECNLDLPSIGSGCII
jgi:hypothetical protein